MLSSSAATSSSWVSHANYSTYPLLFIIDKIHTYLIFLVYMFLTNRHRNTKYGPADKQASDEAGMRDLTEFENKDFRYVL